MSRPVVPLGDTALLGPAGGPLQAAARAAALRRAPPPGVRDVVAGRDAVLVEFDPERADVAALVRALVASPPRAAGPDRPARHHRLEACFDGPDLDEVAERCGLDPGGVVERLCAVELAVTLLGFSPGFAYLESLPAPLDRVGRRDRPRPAVAPGSVALAAGRAAVYPSASPGGWHLVGRCPAPLFDPGADPPAVLAPGDTVRFEARPDVAPAPAGWPRPARPGPGALVVADPGPRTAVQDGGRPGLAHLGVPGAGPADPVALALANRLVGNAPDSAALEVALAGPRLVAHVPLQAAVVGGGAAPTVAGRPVRAGHVVPLDPGQELAVGPLPGGARAVVALAGGVAGPAVLGSQATDALCGLGPGPLARGDALLLGPAPADRGDHLSAGGAARAGPGAGPVVLRVLPGPHPDRFTPGALAALAAVRFAVAPDSDRVGVRLVAAAGAVPRPGPGEVAPLPVVTGTVQVPPSGEPVVLGPDHATLGGYPVLAVVVSADRHLLGRLRPGDEVVLSPVGPEEAAEARAALARDLARAVQGRYPTSAG